MPRRACAVGIKGPGRIFEIDDGMAGVPSDKHDAVGWWREGEGVAGARAGDRCGGEAVDEKVSGVHAGDGFGERHGELGEAGEVPRCRTLAGDRRRSGGCDGDVGDSGGRPEIQGIGGDGVHGVVADGHGTPLKGVGSGDVFTKLGGTFKELDLAQVAIRVRGGRSQLDVRRGGEQSVVRGAHECDRRRAAIGASDQLQIKADVGTATAVLMNLHRENVVARTQMGRTDISFEARIAIIAGIQCERIKRDQSARHVAAEHFHAIQVNHRTVVPEDADAQDRVNGRIGNIERMPEIGGDVLVVAHPAKTDRGGLIILTVTELRRAAAPGRIVKRRNNPGGALIRSVV